MIKSSKDSRYAMDAVVMHDDTKFLCWPLLDLLSFKHKTGPGHCRILLDVIGIDEAQFFDDLYDLCCGAADLDGKTVVPGVDGYYLQRSFGLVLSAILLIDTVTKWTARCEVCGKRAFFTLQKTDEM